MSDITTVGERLSAIAVTGIEQKEETVKKLSKIGPICLCNQPFILGKNGQVYLVKQTPDIFGDLRSEIIPLASWLFVEGEKGAVVRAQALLDELGRFMQSVQSHRDTTLSNLKGV